MNMKEICYHRGFGAFDRETYLRIILTYKDCNQHSINEHLNFINKKISEPEKKFHLEKLKPITKEEVLNGNIIKTGGTVHFKTENFEENKRFLLSVIDGEILLKDEGDILKNKISKLRD